MALSLIHILGLEVIDDPGQDFVPPFQEGLVLFQLVHDFLGVVSVLDFFKELLGLCPVSYTHLDSPVQSAADLKGKNVAVMVGTTGAKYAESHGMVAKQFDSSANALLEVQVGNAPAAIVDKPVGEYFSTLEGKGKGKVRVIPIPDSKSELLGFVLNQDDKELKDAINKAIADMKKDGTYAKLYKKWCSQKAPICV